MSAEAMKKRPEDETWEPLWLGSVVVVVAVQLRKALTLAL